MIVRAALSCEALGECVVARAAGVEAMNALPRWTVDVLSAESDVDLEALISQAATFAFGGDDAALRAIALTVTAAAYRGLHRDGHRYALTLSAIAAPLTLRSGHRVFQDQTSQEIVAKVLEDAGIASSQTSWRLSGQYGKRVYTVQYGETEWAFITRLLADDGINVWFDQDDQGAPRVTFGDAATSHDSIEGAMTVRYEDASGMSRTSASFFDLERTFELAHDKVQVRDFDVRQPDTLIEGEAGAGSLEYYEFPACVLHSEAAAARARTRLEQLQRLMVRVTSKSGCPRLQPGRVVRIEGASDEILHGDHLIVEVAHQINETTRNDSQAAPYENRVLMVPHDPDRAFRPDLPRAAPRVDGIETAVVTGAAGEEIHVDDLGSIKVRFRWDRSGIGDDKSSRWVRCLQMAMHGSMLLPRVGWEVPVVYLDGNPDLPFVLGRLYNGSAPVPYGLPGKKATTTLQSATSPSDGTTHEVRLGDDAGSQEAFIHATKDQTVSVGGTNTVKVAVDETHDVIKSSSVTVKGSQTTTIGSNQTVVVGADMNTTVKGARSETIKGMETIKVTGSYKVQCKGAYSEAVGGLYGIECNQSNTVVQGSFTQTVAGPMALTAGLGTNNSVAAARLEEVKGARKYVAATSYADSVKGAKKITAGAAKDEAGTDEVTNVGGASTVKVGGNGKISSDGPLKVEAPTITISVSGSLTAKGGATLKVGGKVKVSGGKAKFDASKTAKKSTSKVG